MTIIRIEVNDAVMLLIQDSKKNLMVYREYRHGIGKILYVASGWNRKR